MDTSSNCHTSFWILDTSLPSFEPLKEDIQVDIGIVGGGITGITTAYLLAKEGFSIALLEADALAKGTTGHTTAKITSQHDLIYDELLHHVGKEKAQQYYKANEEALNFMKEIVKSKGIDCDFSEEDTYIYANSDNGLTKLEKEKRAYERLHIDGGTASLPIDIPFKDALRMNSQAQFHPLKYAAYLVEELVEMGVKIFENTPAIDVIEKKQPEIVTKEKHTITCDYVLSTSHFPFYDGMGLYFSRMYAERSYIVGVTTEKPVQRGMYLSADEPKRSLRTADMNGTPLLLIGGESHKTGQSHHTAKHFEALREFGDTHFTLQKSLFQWGAQDLITMDKIPYIGRLTANHPNIFVATGYRKWGMTNGTAAALLITNLITEQQSPYIDVFSPSRFYADPSIKHFLSQNANVASEFVKGKIKLPYKQLEDLETNEGALVYYENQKAGGYKDANGDTYAVDTTCTHLRCEVTWNDGEQSWDCPCHGSRFSPTGEVLEGPADEPLQRFK
ncbi:FAD-dependent oxidoreductase [Pontibacillus salicampi]|uniref:FAD-dependent oxidoreductase n=1 Tax=Pontibacillus salicampi TaxID=1449801 RepID=A0ABV6LPC5_9BACI